MRHNNLINCRVRGYTLEEVKAIYTGAEYIESYAGLGRHVWSLDGAIKHAQDDHALEQSISINKDSSANTYGVTITEHKY